MQIRKFKTRQDCEAAVQAQKAVWGLEDIDLLPAHFIIAANDFAEQWGAFERGKLAAIAFAYPSGGGYMLHMLGVLPKHRGKGLGFKLLDAVTKSLKKQGVKKLFWTFDPFDFANSHLYFNKTGALGTKVMFDYYGRLRSAHHGKLPTHRLFAELDLTAPPKKFKKQTESLLPMNEADIRKPGVKNAAKILDKFFKEADALISKGYFAAGINFDKQSEGAKLIFKK